MKKTTVFYGWRIVFACFILMACMIPPVVTMASKFLIPITTEFNISKSSFTLSNTILQTMGIFLSPIISKNLSNGKLKKHLVFSIIGYSISFASYGLVTNIYMHYVISFVLGIFYLNVGTIPVSILINNWFEYKKGVAMSLAMAGTGIGGFLFSPLSTSLLENFGWRKTYLIIGVIVFLTAMLTTTLFIKEKPEDIGLEKLTKDNTIDNVPVVDKGIWDDFKSYRKKIFVWLILIGMLLNGIVHSGSVGQFPAAFEIKYGAIVGSLAVSIYSIVGVFGKMIMGILNDKKGVIYSIIFGTAGFSLAFILLMSTSSNEGLYLLSVFYGLGMGLGAVVPPLLIGAIFKGENYSVAYGYVNSMMQAGMSLGAMFVSMLADKFNTYTVAWFILLVFTIVACALWILGYQKSKSYWTKHL